MNATFHTGAKIQIKEDIASFFDTIRSKQVLEIWKDFFKFSEEIAQILTRLTTNSKGGISQGVPTSPYIANLVFWKDEPTIVKRLNERNFIYSRYVDDVTISSKTKITKDDKTWIISQIIYLFGRNGFKLKRSKHEVTTASKPMINMGLNINCKRKPTIPKSKRHQLRSEVHEFSKNTKKDEQTKRSLTGKIARVKKLHPSIGKKLMKNLEE